MTLKTLGIQLAALATVTILWCLWFATPVAAEVIISELLPDPAATSDKSEWIELYNTGVESVDLTGWKIDTLTLNGNIPAGGYLIVTKNIAEFEKEFGTITNLLEQNISLTNTSDTITLTRPDLSVDTVSYTSTTSAVSLERGGPLCSDKWRWHPSSNSVGKANDYEVEECQLPIPGEPVQIFLSLDDTTWVKNLEIVGSSEVFFKCVGVEDVCSGGVWKVNGIDTMPPVVFKPGEYTYSYFKEKEYVGGNIVIYPRLAITEVMPDPEGSDTGSEYIEIQNLEEDSIDLSGLKIGLSGRDEINLPRTELVGKAFYLYTFTTSTLPNCGGATCPFSITLLWNELVADTMTYTKVESGKSWSLSEDNEWVLDYPPSPGEKNNKKEESFNILISEVYPAPDSKLGEEEWVEVYNYGEESIDLSPLVLKLEDHTYILPSVVLAGGKHFILNDISFSLVNTGATIALANGHTEIDSFIYPKSKAGISSMREWVEEGYSANIVETHTPTPGWRNIVGLEGEIKKDLSNEVETTKDTYIGQILAGDIPNEQVYEMPDLTPKSIGISNVSDSAIPLWSFSLTLGYMLVIGMVVDLFVIKETKRFSLRRIKSELSKVLIPHLSKQPDLW